MIHDAGMATAPDADYACRPLGRRKAHCHRIRTGSDIWDRDYLDLVEPAMMVIKANGRGEIAFGAMQAGLDLEYSRTLVYFTWEGFDEMDGVRGSGSAELQDDGTLEIEFNRHLGDDATLKAKRVTSSKAC